MSYLYPIIICSKCGWTFSRRFSKLIRFDNDFNYYETTCLNCGKKVQFQTRITKLPKYPQSK